MKSLDNLVGTLDAEDFLHTREAFPNSLDLMKQKGVFPYDWFTDASKLESNDFPPRIAFYNKLMDKECEESDYTRAKNVWETMGC